MEGIAETSNIVVTFDRDWINQRRSDGVRVVRLLEKWLKGEDGISLKSSSTVSVTVEMKPARREAFIKGIAEQLKALGEESAWAHATFAGDISGLEVPNAQSVKSTGETTGVGGREAPSAPRSSGKDAKGGMGEGEAKPPDPRETLEDICGKVPIRHCAELEAYVREMATVIPMLQKMGVESTFWHQHLLLAVDEVYGMSEFLHALARLYRE